MSNNFVPDLTALQPGDVARSSDVNERYENVVSGFDRLPAPKDGEPGFSDPTPVGEPVNSDHATTKNYVDTSMTSQVNQAANSATAAAASEAASLVSQNAAAASEAASAASQAAALVSEQAAAATYDLLGS